MIYLYCPNSSRTFNTVLWKCVGVNREEAPDLNGTDRRVFSSIIQAPLQMTENDIILDLWYKDPFRIWRRLLFKARPCPDRTGVYLQQFNSKGYTMYTWSLFLKKHSGIGAGDFSYVCKVARHESTNFLFMITYQHPDMRVKNKVVQCFKEFAT